MLKKVISTLAVLVAAVFAVAQGYELESFDVTATLDSKGRLDVTETIGVHFSEERRGIFRVIPTSYENGRGATRSIFLSNVRVTDGNGAGLTTNLERTGGNLRIRIGDADIFLPPGTRMTYVISYEVAGALNWIESAGGWDESVELYWNLTGNEWDTPILGTTFKISFPTAGEKPVRARLFAGAYGSRASVQLDEAGDAEDAEQGTALALRADHVAGSASALPFGAGVTIVLGLPADLIAKPTWSESAWMFLRSNLGFGIPLFMLFGFFVAWMRFGRDPKGGPMVVQFEPPEGLSGPECGTVLDERVDARDLAAGIVSLAVKGYLDVYPKEEGLIFKKRKADLEVRERGAGPEITLFEGKLLKRLKSIKGRITDSDLRTSVAPYVPEFKTSLYEVLVDRGYYRGLPTTVRTGWLVGGIAVIALLFFVTLALNPISNPVPSMVGGVLGLIVVVSFMGAMPKRTTKGAKVRQQVKGFEEFIRRARGNELEWMSEKHPDAVLFEEYLPHAVAFGLTQEWAAAFDGILKEPPNWYHSPGGNFNALAFGSDFNAMTESVSSAATTPPRSSGSSGGSSGFSSGGGFSGGGMGGGGGGSW